MLAIRVAARPDTTGRRTYGSYRAEIFASGLAVLVMLAVAAFIVVEAIGRMDAAPVAVATAPMLVVGGLGLVVNIAAMLLLRAGASENLNVKGAYLEVIADAAGSVGVIVAGLLVLATGMVLWDTVVAVGIGGFVVVRAVVWADRSSPSSPSTCPRGWTHTLSRLTSRASAASTTYTTCTCGR
ncbi:MAG TPA: cation diffusion facilitator family transporter [Actinopolymorphaceae bacterium]